MDSDEILKAELQKALAENERLRDENAKLRLRVHQSTDAAPHQAELRSARASDRALQSDAALKRRDRLLITNSSIPRDKPDR